MVILKGNLPGEPPLEITPAGIVLTVPANDGGCQPCPLFDDEGYSCRAMDRREPVGAYVKRPDWCPLDTGPVTVEIRKP